MALLRERAASNASLCGHGLGYQYETEALIVTHLELFTFARAFIAAAICECVLADQGAKNSLLMISSWSKRAFPIESCHPNYYRYMLTYERHRELTWATE